MFLMCILDFWTCSLSLRLSCSPISPLPSSTVGQIFNNELFGAVAEEKEVKGIVSKLMEARHSKSMDSYELLAQFCSKESVTKFILPLKEVRGEYKKTHLSVQESICV